MRASDNMKVLTDRRDRLKAELETIKARLDEVEGLIRLMTGQPVPEHAAPEQRIKRGSIKTALLDLAAEAAETGLSVTDCLERAKPRLGVDLDRASVSSMLSRFKKEDVMVFDGTRYRLKQYATLREVA